MKEKIFDLLLNYKKRPRMFFHTKEAFAQSVDTCLNILDIQTRNVFVKHFRGVGQSYSTEKMLTEVDDDFAREYFEDIEKLLLEHNIDLKKYELLK